MSAIKSSMKARVRQGLYGSESEEEDSDEERLLQAKREVSLACAMGGESRGGGVTEFCKWPNIVMI